MRDKLAKVEGLRTEWAATFCRYGSKPAFRGPPLKTVLLVEIKDAAGVQVADHIWLNFTNEFRELHLEPGEQVRFAARVAPYLKGYGAPEDKALDFKLSRPSNIRRISPAPLAALPLLAPAPGGQLNLF